MNRTRIPIRNARPLTTFDDIDMLDLLKSEFLALLNFSDLVAYLI